MGDKKRWNDPANDGQIDYIKIGIRMFALIMLLALAALIKIAIANHWIDSFNENARILGL